jgi:hypothetical protein
MKKAPKQRRKELWGAPAAGPRHVPGHELYLEPRWGRFVGACACGQFALLRNRNHIETAHRQHLAVAGGYTRRDRIQKAINLRTKAHWLVLKTSSSGAWRVDCDCGWKSAVATDDETVIRAARGHLAAAEQAKATAAALRSSPPSSNGARQRHRRKPLVIPEPSRAEQIRTRRLQQLRSAGNPTRHPEPSAFNPGAEGSRTEASPQGTDGLAVIPAVIPPDPTAANQTALYGMPPQPELPRPYWTGLSGRLAVIS